MLSIKKCRELIPDSDKLSDSYIEKVRDETHSLVELIYEVWAEERKKKQHD